MLVAGSPSVGARARDAARRLPVRRRRRRDQPLVRPRHRRADGAHRDRPVAAGPHLAARRADLRARARRAGVRAELAIVVNPLAASLSLAGFVGYAVGLHGAGSSAARRRTSSSAAPPAPCRRSSAGRRSTGSLVRARDLHVRDRLLLDAAALLGAEPADEGRVREGRRPDAARRARRGRDAPPDPALHGAALRGDAAAVLRRGGFGRFYLVVVAARSAPSSSALRGRSCGAARTAARALRLYLFSLAYLALLFAAMVADVKL